MKVAICIPNLNIGGAEKSLVSIAEYLHDRNHDVTIVVSSHNDRQNNFLLKDGIKFTSLNKKRVITSILELGRFMKAHKPDVVISGITHMNEMVILSKLIHLQSHYLIIRESMIHTLKPRGFLKKLDRLALRMLYKRANRMLCVSEYSRKNLDSIGVTNKNTSVFYTPVWDSEAALAAKAPLPPNFSYLGDIPFLVAVGRLNTVKNYKFMLKSFAGTTKHIPHKLVLIGDGRLKDDLRGYADALGIGSRVVFAGYQTNPLAFVSRASLFLQTSFHEAGSRALIEAMCLGITPVIVDKSGSEFTGYGRYGIVLKTHDEAMYSKLICDAINVPSLNKCDIMNYAQKMFSAEAQISKLESFFPPSAQ